MARRIVVGFATGLLLLVACVSSIFGQSSEKAVKASGVVSTSAIRPGDKFRIAVKLDVADGYHINAHVPSLDFLIPTSVDIQPASGLKIGSPVYPAPELKSFSFSPDKKLSVHEGSVVITADAEAASDLKPGSGTIAAKVQVQSCNDSQCLAPVTLDVQIPVTFAAAGTAVSAANQDIFSQAGSQTTPAAGSPIQSVGTSSQELDSAGSNQISDWIGKYGLPVTLFFVFLSGLALNTTPCVYPIIPITVGFFANQSKEGETTRLGRMFAMSAFYVLGMAITYSVLGVVASLTHGLFGAALRNPFVLIGLAVLMVALALSMFGVYEFKLPEALNRFATSSTQSSSGMAGALVMGLTMGIVAAPCIGPFVVALLVHVGAKGSPSYGFLLFFVLALGLGAPYLVLGTFSGAIGKLPRSGMWMVTVRKVFGLVLVGMAIYFLTPLLSKYSTPVLVAFFAAAAIYLIFFEAGKAKPKQFGWVLRVIGLAAAVAAVFFVIPSKTEAEIEWKPYSEQALAAAQKAGRPVIVDTFANWCIPCKELDKRTFTDASVKREAEKFVMLKLDLTTKAPGSEEARAVEKFNIPGVPTVVFIDPSGQVVRGLTLQEFEKPEPFLDRMKKLASAPTSSPAGAIKQASNAPSDGGKPLPSANLKLLAGSSLDLSSQKGKVVLLDFWATWCLPCASEIPMFNAMHQEYGAKGLNIVGVSLDGGGAAAVKPFLKEHPMQYTVALGGADVSSAFGIGETLPVTIIVDKQGRIRYTHTGVTPKETLQNEIEGLLND